MTFWDFSAPLYDLAETVNGKAYNVMLKIIRELIPKNASVLEAAAGTGSISLAASENASHILCTDISERMLNVARRKVKKARAKNITVENRSIYDLNEPDSSFDIVIAGQVLHLIHEPEVAASELRRVAKSMVVLPMSLTKDLCGMAKVNIGVYKLFGFSPKIEFDDNSYKAFLPTIGFNDCEFVTINGKIPMMVAVWKKGTFSDATA